VVTTDIKVEMLENIYEMVCESKIMYGIEIWGLNGAWKEVGKVADKFNYLGVTLDSTGSWKN
jgi:hypothetical protein